MRWAVLVLCFSSLAAGDLDQLRQLSEINRYFDLRRALQEPGWGSTETLFYRGAVAGRFGREAEGSELLQRFLGTNPPADMTRKALQELASDFERLGRYKEAADAWRQALLLTPADDADREGNENTRMLLDSLSDVAPQTVDFGTAAPLTAVRNRLGSWNVPVQVNGIAGQWIFDTGANVSTVTESEASRMGIAVRDSKGFVTGSTGKRNKLRLAVGDVQCGNVRIHRVIFLVLADKALHIGPIHTQINGILGLPVLHAIGRVGVGHDGAVELRPPEPSAEGTPNLFFDGETPIVEVTHNGHQLQMMLDTGANSSDFYPSFRTAMSAEELAEVKTKKEKFGGAGGTIARKMATVPELQIQISATTITLKKLGLMPEAPPGDARFRDGVIGMDALWSGFSVDFGAMRVTVQ